MFRRNQSSSCTFGAGTFRLSQPRAAGAVATRATATAGIAGQNSVTWLSWAPSAFWNRAGSNHILIRHIAATKPIKIIENHINGSSDSSFPCLTFVFDPVSVAVGIRQKHALTCTLCMWRRTNHMRGLSAFCFWALPDAVDAMLGRMMT